MRDDYGTLLLEWEFGSSVGMHVWRVIYEPLSV